VQAISHCLLEDFDLIFGQIVQDGLDVGVREYCERHLAGFLLTSFVRNWFWVPLVDCHSVVCGKETVTLGREYGLLNDLV
jgi:hypothetical protein